MHVAIQSMPGEAPNIEELAHQVIDFLAPGRFEFIWFGAYTDRDQKIAYKADKRSTTHLHLIVKGRVSEIRAYTEKWNSYRNSNGNKLFYAQPCVDGLSGNLYYMLKGLLLDHGYNREPYGAVLKAEKKRPFNFLGLILIALKDAMSVKKNPFCCDKNGFCLTQKFHDSNVVGFYLDLFFLIDGRANAPPGCFCCC